MFELEKNELEKEVRAASTSANDIEAAKKRKSSWKGS